MINFQKEQHETHTFFTDRKKVVDKWLPGIVPVQHYDLFPLRVTKQNKLVGILKKETDIRNEFLDLFDKLVNWVEPEILWIANKKAWAWLKERNIEELIAGHKRVLLIKNNGFKAEKVIVTNHWIWRPYCPPMSDTEFKIIKNALAP